MVVELANRLARLQGTPGKVFVQQTRDIHIEPDDINRMTDAINEAFKQVEDFPEVIFDE
ncbi:MAG: hypothetical protein IAE89_15995 [Anaerolineae bacterium]|nr:hypothetical protein [Anaerolineae bacterium]